MLPLSEPRFRWTVKEAKRALKKRLQKEKIETDDVTGKKSSESQPGAETALAP